MIKKTVFLSWSGPVSKHVADALRQWLPMVLNNVIPWMSDSDILPGQPWSQRLGDILSSTHFGILCTTKTNQQSPWLLFESGALAKSVQESHVCPLLVDVPLAQLSGPLALFQAVTCDQNGMLKLVRTLNAALGDLGMAEDMLSTAFKALWPVFEQRCWPLPQDQTDPGPERSQADILSEVLEMSRMHVRLTAALANSISARADFDEPIVLPSSGLSAVSTGDVNKVQSIVFAERAKGFRREGKYADAAVLFQQALRLDPGNEELCVALAVTKSYLPDDRVSRTRAIHELSRLLEKNPSISKALYNRACLKTRISDEDLKDASSPTFSVEEILADLKRAIELYPKYREVALSDPDLDSLRKEPGFFSILAEEVQ